MCGIIGILGKHGSAAERAMEALKRLEYRGYDSAGVATLDDGKLGRRRAAGKLSNLQTLLKEEPIAGLTGIGHTRWATHGAATTGNAHPHFAGPVALVHNGIIENFRRLRDELKVNTTCGASNISFGLPNRHGINAAFLSMAASYGMTSAIMNPLHDPDMHAIWGADVINGYDKDCAHWIKRFREPAPEGAEGGRGARGERGRRRRSAA